MMVKLGDDVKTGQKVIEDKKNVCQSFTHNCSMYIISNKG